MLIYIIIRAQECQDVFRKNSKKICEKYQMLCVKAEMIHIYGKKGNNKRENTGKAAGSSENIFLILQKKRMRVWLEGAESEQTWRWKQRNAFGRKM
jgi:hypothetical protein